MDLTNLACDELKQLAEDAKRELQVRNEKQRRDEREAVVGTDKFKKLMIHYKKAQERLCNLEKESVLKITVPVTIILDAELWAKPEGRINLLSVYDVFHNEMSAGKIGATTGLTKIQRQVLQEGLDQLVENACDDIEKLFAETMKEQEAAVRELNKILGELMSLNVTWEDLDE